MNKPDAEPVGVGHAADLGRPAVDADFALIGTVDAAQDIDEGGLSGAVLAEQGMDLPAAQLEVHAVQRDDAAEALADAAEREQCRG